MQPYDYRSMVKDPFESALEGVKLGASIADLRAQAEQRQAIAQKTQQEQLAKQQQVEQFNLARTAFFNNPNPTIRDASTFLSFLSKDQQAAFEPYVKQISEAENKASLNFGLQVMSALERKPEYAAELLEQRAEAEKNPQNAQFYKQLAARTRENPADAIKVGTLLLAPIPGAKEALENIAKAQETKQKAEEAPIQLRKLTAEAITKEAEAKYAPDKFGLEIGLTQAQIEQAKAARRAQDAAAKASGATAARAQAEADQISSGIIPADKRPEAETKFRKEYSDQTKGYQEVKSAYSRILASEDSAVGDLSLIFGYMKMLDPGSVVREGEFATAQNAAGVDDRVRNLYNRVMSGERLSESQRKSFKGQANKLYSTAQQQEGQVRKGIERIAKGYGLNTSNIFYTAEEIPPATPAIPPAPKTVSEGAEGVSKSGRPMVFRNGGWVYK